MTSGFDSFSLAIFTTLTPAGIVAFICAALPLFFFSLEDEKRTRLNHFLAIPYAFVLIGFIASATHLGTPSNALHVFSGIGRSPLSNEVLLAVIFLFLAGSYWMFTFRESFPVALARLWLGIACLTGLALIAMTSLAYSVETVITWISWATPFNLWLCSLLAGPIIGAFMCVYAQVTLPKFLLALNVLALGALVVGAVFLFVYYSSLFDVANNEFSAIELMPHYPLVIVANVLFGSAGIALAFVSLQKSLSRNKKLLILAASITCLVLAVFVPRIAFYELHMTAGF